MMQIRRIFRIGLLKITWFGWFIFLASGWEIDLRLFLFNKAWVDLPTFFLKNHGLV